MEKYSKLADDIIKNVGGKENMDGVITVMKAMGQYMVVIGEHVPHVYSEVCEKINMKPYGGAEESNEKGKKSSIFKHILDVVMGGMGPCLNMICASGIVKGLTTLLLFLGVVNQGDGLYLLLSAIGDGIFFFLPMILGFNVAKKSKWIHS